MRTISRTREHALQERLRVTHARTFARRLSAELNRVAADASDGDLRRLDPVITAHGVRLERMLMAEYRSIFTTFGGRVLSQLGRVPKSRDEVLEFKAAVDDEYREQVAKFTRRWSARKATDISKTTQKKIERVIRMGASEDWTYAQIAKTIRERVGGSMGKRRADTIARTEVHAASQDAGFEMAQASGVDLTKEWVSINDDRTREDHVEADGQERAMHEPFTVGDDELQYPGDPSGLPEQVINCRCVCIYNPVR